MLNMSQYCVFAGIVAVALALVCYVLAFASGRVAQARTALAVESPSGEITTSALVVARSGVAVFGTLTTWLALAFLSRGACLPRGRHGPRPVREHV